MNIPPTSTSTSIVPTPVQHTAASLTQPQPSTVKPVCWWQRPRGWLTRFLVLRYLADDKQSEITGALDLFTLRFHDPKLEAKYQEALRAFAVPRNRNLFVIGAVSGLVTLTIADFWMAKSHDAGFWASYLPQTIGNTFYVLGMVLHWFVGQMYVSACTVLGFFAMFINLTLNWNLPDLLGLYEVDDPRRSFAIRPGAMMQFTAYIFAVSRTPIMAKSALLFAFVHIVIFFVAQYQYVPGIHRYILELLAIIVNIIMTTYRKETYFRYITWLQWRLQREIGEFDNPELNAVKISLKTSKNRDPESVLSASPSAISLDSMAAVGGGSPSLNASPDMTTSKQNMISPQPSHSDPNSMEPAPRCLSLPTWPATLKRFLFIQQDEAREQQVDEFFSVQSIGQTKVSLLVSALVLIFNVSLDALNQDLHLLDLLLRGFVCPLLMMVYAFGRGPMTLRWKNGRQYAKVYACFLYLFVCGCNILLLQLQKRNAQRFAPQRTYLMAIAQMCVSGATVLGLRFYLLLPLSLLTTMGVTASLVTTGFEKMSSLLAMVVIAMTSSWFLRSYEKTMYTYYCLDRRWKALVQSMASRKLGTIFRSSPMAGSSPVLTVSPSMDRSNVPCSTQSARVV